MKAKKHRFTLRTALATLLTLSLLVATAAFFGANAAEGDIEQGQCGENAMFILYDSGRLVISGSGDMYDFNVDKDDGEPLWFSVRESITSVVIQDGITSIGNDAFFGCKYLQTIAIPASVSKIGYDVFAYCSNLNEINLAEENATFCNVDGVIYNTERTRLVAFPTTKTDFNSIPDTVISLGSFKGTIITSIKIPKEMTCIYEEQFSNCTSLENIILPDGVATIYSYAFAGCTSLKSITIPKSLQSIYPGVFEGSGLEEIYYQGTEAEWAQVKIDSDNYKLSWIKNNKKIHYTTVPTDPTTDPTDPTDPVTDPTDPVTDPTDPVTDPTDPTTDPTTQPTTQPTTAPTTAPTTQPTTAPTTAPTQANEPEDSDVAVEGESGFVDDAETLDKDGKPVQLQGVKLIVGNIETNKKKTVLDAIAHYNETFDADSDNVALYDISLVDNNKAHVTLTDGNKVRVCLKYPDNLGRQSEQYTFHLYHQKADGTLEEIAIDCKPNGIWFETDSFSPYALVWSEAAEITSDSPNTGEANTAASVACALALASVLCAGAVICRRKIAA